MMKVIFDKMEAVIKDIAAAEGYSYVFEQQNAGLMVAPPSANMTQELVRRYNAKYGKSGAAPAKKAERQEGRTGIRREVGGPVHFSLAELAERVGGRVEGDGSIRIERVMPLEDAGPGDISFFANRRVRRRVRRHPGGGGDRRGRRGGGAGTHRPARGERLPGLRPDLDPVPPAARAGARDRRRGRSIAPGARVDPSAEVQDFAYVGPGRLGGGAHHPLPGRRRRGRGAHRRRLHPLPERGGAGALHRRQPLHPRSPGRWWAATASASRSTWRATAPVRATTRCPQSGIAELEDDVELGRQHLRRPRAPWADRDPQGRQDRRPGR